jgi:hypothetical protein
MLFAFENMHKRNDFENPNVGLNLSQIQMLQSVSKSFQTKYLAISIF